MDQQILAIKTNSEPIEVYLLDNSGQTIDSARWRAGYELSQTLLKQVIKLLKTNKSQLNNLAGVIVCNSPGGFTSLRLGVLTANTLAYGLNIPVVGAEEGDGWLKAGIQALKKAKPGEYVLPNYGRPPHITQPKK